jgi:hypothetical protein
MESGEIVYSHSIIEFVAVANEYCTFMESATGFPKREFLEKTSKILPLLYYKASLLPALESVLEDGNEKYVTEEQYESVYHGILGLLGAHNDYLEVIDPVYRDSQENVRGSIAEDLADIYQDLKDFIMVYRLGTPEIMQESIYECKTSFETIWGQRLVNALKVIHSLVTGEDPLEDEPAPGEQAEEKETDTSNWIISQRQKIWGQDES